MLLLVVAAFGPWSAASVSEFSQYNRLEKLLVAHDILQDGKVVKTDESMTFDDQKSISSKVQYLFTSGRSNKLRKWFPDKTDEEWKKFRAGEVVEAMGIRFISAYERAPEDSAFNITREKIYKHFINVKGYDYVLPHMYAYPKKEASQYDELKADDAEGIPRITWTMTEDNILTLSIEGRGDFAFDLGKLVKKVQQLPDNSSQPIVLEESRNGTDVRLSFTQLSGRYEEGDVKVLSVAFSIAANF